MLKASLILIYFY